MSRAEIDDTIESLSGEVPAPRMIKVVPIFHQCLTSMLTFFSSVIPPNVMDRSKHITLLVHGFADASKEVLGASFYCGGKIKFRIGTWGSDSEN